MFKASLATGRVDKMRTIFALLFALIGIGNTAAQVTIPPAAFTCDFRLPGAVTACGVTVARAQAGNTDLLPASTPGYAYNTFATNTPRFTPGRGLLSEETRTNFLLNSLTPATQTTGSLATGAYVLWVNEPSAGSGSATISAGTATGCVPLNSVGVPSGTATATTGTWATLVITGAGTCTVTVSGSLTAFQLERCGITTLLPCYGTSMIVTAGATVARPADGSLQITNAADKTVVFGTTATVLCEVDQVNNWVNTNDGFLCSTNTDAFFQLALNSISLGYQTAQCKFGAVALVNNFGPMPITNVFTVGAGTSGTSLVVAAVSNGKGVVNNNPLYTYTNPGTIPAGTLITAIPGGGGAGTYTTSKATTVVLNQLIYQLTSGGGWGSSFGTMKAAIAWDGTGRSCQVNGSTVQRDATIKTAGDTGFFLGNVGGSNHAINGYVHAITAWSTRLSDDQITYLTQQGPAYAVDSNASSFQVLNSGSAVPPIAVSTHNFAGPLNTPIPPATQAALVKQVGADAVRVEAQWLAIEKSLGVYDWSTIDPFIAAYLAQGTKIHLLLSYGNSLYIGCGTGVLKAFCSAGNIFNATSSGTSLTITGFLGTAIVPGDGNQILSLASGIPANTHITAQQSGTTGSNGVYTTDNATTLTGTQQVSQPLAAANLGYSNFVAAAAARYDGMSVTAGVGHLLVVELGNEVNCAYSSTASTATVPSSINYAYQAAAGAAAIKAAAALVPVTTAGMGQCGSGASLTNTFMTNMINTINSFSSLSNIDAFANHPYQQAFNPEPVITPVQSFNAATANAKPQWNTEQGYLGPTNIQVIQEITRAYYACRLMMSELASGTGEIMWYDFIDQSANNPGYGLFANSNAPTMVATPAATAFTNCKAATVGATAWSVKYYQASDTYLATFTNASGTNAVIWSPSTSVNFTWNAPAFSSVSAQDSLGAIVVPTVNGNAYTVPLGNGDPIIITGLN